MSSSYIYALTQRHAAIERKIQEAMKAPAPDTLHIMALKRLRLAYRDRIRLAISQKRLRASASRTKRWVPPRSPRASSSTDIQFTEGT